MGNSKTPAYERRKFNPKQRFPEGGQTPPPGRYGGDKNPRPTNTEYSSQYSCLRRREEHRTPSHMMTATNGIRCKEPPK